MRVLLRVCCVIIVGCGGRSELTGAVAEGDAGDVESGACVNETVASGRAVNEWPILAVDDNEDVYWAVDDSVTTTKVWKRANASNTLIADIGFDLVSSLVLRKDDVLFATWSGTIYAVSKSGGALRTLASSLNGGGVVTTFHDDIFYSSLGSVVRIDPTGAVSFVLGTQVNQAAVITVDGDSLYVGAGGTIMWLDPATSLTSTIATGVQQIAALHVDGSRLVFLELYDETTQYPVVMSVDKSGGEPAILFSSTNHLYPVDLAVDASGVFVLLSGHGYILGGQVLRLDANGPTTLAESQIDGTHMFLDLALGPKSIVWSQNRDAPTADDDPIVLRICK